MVEPSPDAIEKFERCSRLYRWSRDYLGGRINPLAAVYAGLDAGLTGGDPYSAVMELAVNPGLDFGCPDVYSAAVSHARLAELLTIYLRGGDSLWIRSGSVWESGPDLRRIVLIDRWSEERKMAAIRSWRTLAPICTEDRPMLLNFISIGQTVDGRRVSPWTRAWAHPKNNAIRFKKLDGDSLGPGWAQVWRERWQGDPMRWLSVMQRDKCFDELVHSVRVPVPQRREEYLADLERIEREMVELPADPPMSRDGCYRFSPCVFVPVCHGPTKVTPADCGWIKVEDIKNSSLPKQLYANV